MVGIYRMLGPFFDMSKAITMLHFAGLKLAAGYFLWSHGNYRYAYGAATFAA
ncbi:MAG: hypothetical protein KDD98_01060 [Sphingomonadaceae bacterium]|nr:hypothetical protein [Sphingomonadaceae bacterium]